MLARKTNPFQTPDTQRQTRAFFRAVLSTRGERNSAERECARLGVVLQRAAGENTGTSGAYLVPVELVQTITALAEIYGSFRRWARVVRLSSDTARVPLRTSNATFGFTGESITIAESDNAYAMCSLVMKKVAALILCSNELLEDSASFELDLAGAFGEALAKLEDTVGWNGAGISTDGGIIGITTQLEDGLHAGAIAAAAGHDTFAEIDATDLGTVMGALPSRALTNAAWYVSARGAALAFYRLGASGGGIGRNAMGEATFAGFPIRIVQVLPTATTTLASRAMLCFGDLQQSSMLGLRADLVIAKSDLGLSWNADQTRFRAIERFDIVSHDLGNSTTPGSMLALIGTA